MANFFHERLFKEPNSSYFLFGPRGTGKSTWLKRNHQQSLWIDLLDPPTFRSYVSRPELLIELVEANKDKKYVVIDEIQKVPDLLSVVHSLIEKKWGIHFILTGSSARKLKKTGVDLLAGRALIRTFHPFMAIEIKNEFNLEKALSYGMLPLVISSDVPKEVLKAYVATYLQQEVQAEGLVRNIGHFARFLEIISFSHGELINVSNIARDSEVERKLVISYLSILEDLLLSFTLPVFTKRAKRELVAHEKLYIFDPGVYRSLRPMGPMDRPELADGHALEGLVGQHLRAWIAYSGRDCKLYFWRTRHGVEVDFIIYGEDTFSAFEVKSSKRISPEDVRALKAFKEDYPNANVCLIYTGHERLLVNSILCIPCTEFLLNLDPQKQFSTELGTMKTLNQ
jgi:predicted AAA+ superfamily ATPase